jgi:hypothetical protein
LSQQAEPKRCGYGKYEALEHVFELLFLFLFRKSPNLDVTGVTDVTDVTGVTDVLMLWLLEKKDIEVQRDERKRNEKTREKGEQL